MNSSLMKKLLYLAIIVAAPAGCLRCGFYEPGGKSPAILLPSPALWQIHRFDVGYRQRAHTRDRVELPDSSRGNDQLGGSVGETFAAVIVLGLANLGALIFFLGGLKEKVKNLEGRQDKLEFEVSVVRVDVGEIKGQLKPRAEAQI